jgi:hypothetical protein
MSASPNYGWHKKWTDLGQGRYVHASGLECLVSRAENGTLTANAQNAQEWAHLIAATVPARGINLYFAQLTQEALRLVEYSERMQSHKAKKRLARGEE